MSYLIRKTNGETIQVESKEINTDTNIKLLGRGVEDYGQYIAENLLRMLENFSSPYEPGTEDSSLDGSPVKGQLWYDSAEDILKYYDGQEFVSLLSGNVIVEAANSLRFPRKISLTNDAVGSVLFDGSQDVEINTLVKKSLEAGRLSNPVKLSFSGDIEGSVTFDGSQDVDMPIRIINNGVKTILSFTGDGNSLFVTEFSDSSTIDVDLSHVHNIEDINGLREELDSKASINDVANLEQNTVSVVADIVGQLTRGTSSLQERELKVLELVISGEPNSDRYIVIPSTKMNFSGNTEINYGYVRVYVNGSLYEEYEVRPRTIIDENGNLDRVLDTYIDNIRVDIPNSLETSVVTMFIVSKRGDFGVSVESENQVIHLITDSEKLSTEDLTNTPNVPNPTFNVTSDVLALEEGETVTFEVETTNFPDGTLYWTIAPGFNLTSDDFVGDIEGTVNIVNGAGRWEMTVAEDGLSEIREPFAAQIRTGSVNGPVVVSSSNVTINPNNATPDPTYSVAPSSTSVNEGSNVVFTVNTTNFPDGDLFWTVSEDSGLITVLDFNSGVLSGRVSISNNTGSWIVTPRLDNSTEGSESFSIQIRTGSSTGPVVATSSTVTINDTSTSGGGGVIVGGGCLLPHVLITMADGSVKRADEVNVGDQLLGATFDGMLDESDPEWREWTTDDISSFTTSVSTVKAVKYDSYGTYFNINGTLSITQNHMLFTLSDGEWKWKDARDIKIGESLINNTGDISLITSIESIESVVDVIDFDVEHVDTYFAGEYLVHNSDAVKN